MKDSECLQKTKRIEFEDEFINFEFIDEISTRILSKLTVWANEEIFFKNGGELTYSTPLKDSINAGAIHNPQSPYSPVIIIHAGMLIEIYRDSFTFPAVSKRIAEETDTITNFNNQFENASFTFSEGLPKIRKEYHSSLSKEFGPAFIEKKHPKLDSNDIVARFNMFEIMLAWVFFHELSHLIQCHYKLQKSSISEDKIEFYEIQESSSSPNDHIRSQAREVLADLEGFDLTVKYIIREEIFCAETMYLLFCAQTCMFNIKN